MALIKHRPRITLLTPAQLAPGKPFDATVVLQAQRPVPVAYVEIELEGLEERSLRSGNNQIRRVRHICLARARVMGEADLPAGESPFRARFQMPVHAPPTYRGSQVTVSYLMHVRASIPWWPDARASFELNVGRDPQERLPRSKPLLFSSRPEGPHANEPHVEGSLSADAVVAGSLLSGAVALNNVEYARYTGLRLALVGTEQVTVSGRSSAVEAHRYEVYMPIAELSEGQQREFRMRLPQHIPASYAANTETWSLTWQFECKAEIRWARDLALRVPISVIPWHERTWRDNVNQHTAPPTVGSERVQAVWRKVAARHGLGFDGRRMRGTLSGCDVAIERQHRGKRGVYLLGRVGFSSLHLGLGIEPTRGFRLTGSKGVPLGESKWDSQHHVTCRDPSQVRAIGPELRGALIGLRRVHMNDIELSAELHNAGATEGKLESFVNALREAAAGIADLAERIPPPELMRGGLDAWRSFAESLDGALTTAHMAVDGVVAGCPARVRTHWSPTGAPLHTVLEVDAPMVIEDRVRGSFAGLAAAPGIAISAADTRQLAELDDPAMLEAIAEDAWLIDITAETLAVTLPAPILDPRPLGAKLYAMVEWVRHVGGAAGPYR